MSVMFERFDFQIVEVKQLLDLLPQVAILAVLLGLAVVASRPRKYGEFDIVGDKNDLRAALRKGTELVSCLRCITVTSGGRLSRTLGPPVIVPYLRLRHTHLPFPSSSSPLAMIDEIKSLPDSKVSTAPELFKRAGGHYSKLGTNALAAIKALRIDLRRRTTTIPQLTEEARYAFDDALGTFREWTPLAVFPRINRAVAIVSGRVFLGQRLSRQEEWISLSSEWAVHVFGIMRAIQRYPSWLRPYVMPYLPETRQVLAHRAKVKAFLAPTFQMHIEAKENKSSVEGEEESFVSWLMKYIAPRHTTIESLTRHHMSITWASIHTSTYALTQILFDLAARPEYQDILREEIEDVFPTSSTEEVTQADLAKLAKMDSFMKEAMRLNPLTIVAPLRMVTAEPLTLSSGQTLQPGDSFGFDSTSINHSTELYSSPGPETFDGLRYYRMRQKAGEEQKHQFGVTGVQETFGFGHGIHACPGRHSATIEIKILLIHMLTSYDFKLKDGHKRPSNGLDEIWWRWTPDPTAEVLIKSS
ncbi:hypothetical protein PG994_014534 [Apiospora phragmitis]|uniref:Cytochrome P450 monooxygenase n=1 Tax=Apiospora phragmitis TaxID=2905665 RepID=A0ABR1T519_9PEZI